MLAYSSAVGQYIPSLLIFPYTRNPRFNALEGFEDALFPRKNPVDGLLRRSFSASWETSSFPTSEKNDQWCCLCMVIPVITPWPSLFCLFPMLFWLLLLKLSVVYFQLCLLNSVVFVLVFRNELTAPLSLFVNTLPANKKPVCNLAFTPLLWVLFFLVHRPWTPVGTPSLNMQVNIQPIWMWAGYLRCFCCCSKLSHHTRTILSIYGARKKIWMKKEVGWRTGKTELGTAWRKKESLTGKSNP